MKRLIGFCLVLCFSTYALGADTNEGEKFLSSGNAESDIAHFRAMKQRLGFDIGALIPQKDFKQFNAAPMIGIHFSWDAIPPFSIVLGMAHSSTGSVGGVATKLSVNEIDLSTQANFPISIFTPFVRVGASLYFNDVNLGTRYITGGDDTYLTTAGLTLAAGLDIIVGREMSVGFEGVFHFAIPKKLTLSDGSSFDLGSSFTSGNLRLSF